MLTAYFKKNRDISCTRNCLYSEFPSLYAWNSTSKEWIKRKTKTGAVGRMTFVSPVEGERYYLRLLLCNVRGATSFKDLLIVNGAVVDSFKTSCEQRGFLARDDYAEACMKEAVSVQMPCALRRLFATLLLYVESINPLVLWNQFYNHLSEDYSHSQQNRAMTIARLTYNDVEMYVESMGKRMSDFNIPEPSKAENDSIHCSREVIDALNAHVPEEFVNWHEKLNSLQKEAYDGIMHAIEHNKSCSFFIDGPGGAGKTFLYCALYATLQLQGKIVLPTATSGIAASNIPSGRTAHSRFKISIDSNGPIVCNVSKQSSLASLLKSTALIIWDESSMAKKEEIEALDSLMRDICDIDRPFGGKIVVFGGDFRQVLPMLPHKGQNEAIKASLVSSYLWPSLEKYRLTENMRARDDLGFSEFLLRVGNGSLQDTECAAISVPYDILQCTEITEDYIEQIISATYPELLSHEYNYDIFSERAILTPTNDGVDVINDDIIRRFHGDAVTYTGIDTLIDDNNNLCTPEFINSLCPAGMSPYKLTLKKNCPVILLRNLDPSHELCNRTRLICKEFHPNIIICEIASRYHKGDVVILPRINLRPPSSMQYPFSFQRKQFPIKLCFAMTINKSQGQTLQRVCVFLQ